MWQEELASKGPEKASLASVFLRFSRRRLLLGVVILIVALALLILSVVRAHTYTRTHTHTKPNTRTHTCTLVRVDTQGWICIPKHTAIAPLAQSVLKLHSHSLTHNRFFVAAKLSCVYTRGLSSCRLFSRPLFRMKPVRALSAKVVVQTTAYDCMSCSKQLAKAGERNSPRKATARAMFLQVVFSVVLNRTADLFSSSIW